MLNSTDLQYIKVTQLHASLETDAVPDEVNAEFSVADINVQGAEHYVRVSVAHAARFFTAEETVAHISFVHSAHFKYRADEPPTRPVLEAWVKENVYFMIYPYVRETLQSACGQLGLPAMVLGYLNRGEVIPRTIAVVVSNTRFDQSITAPDDE